MKQDTRKIYQQASSLFPDDGILRPRPKKFIVDGTLDGGGRTAISAETKTGVTDALLIARETDSPNLRIMAFITGR